MPVFKQQFKIEDAEAVGSTSFGLWIRHKDWEKDQFIPQSQIDDDSEIWKEGQSGKLVISEWLAIKKGLVDEQ